MITKIEENDGIMTVYLEGRMDTPSSSETDDELAPLYETECKEIVIDCSQLDYIASSGLRLLLGVLKKAQAAGSHVVLKNVNDVVKDVLDLTGFVALFDIE